MAFVVTTRLESVKEMLRKLREDVAALPTPKFSGAPAECPTCGGEAVYIYGRNQKRRGIRGTNCKCPLWWSPKTVAEENAEQ